MKKLLLIMCMLFTLSITAQNKIYNATQFNLNNFAIKCCTALKIDSVSITIQQLNGLLFNKYYAGCDEVSKNNYLIGLSNLLSFEQSQEALAHELVHIAQLNHKRLEIINKDTIKFDNKLYTFSIDNHINDIQEKEAFKISKELVKTIPYKF